jgi:hypothetical protein
MKILVGVNTLTSVDQMVYLSHMQFWTRTVKQYPKDDFLFFAPQRMSVDNMRNQCVKAALQYECDYILFIDDDVVVEPHTFKSLYECNLDIVMALTYIRGYPFEPMFFSFKDAEKQSLSLFGEFKDKINDKGVVLCDAIGNSCTLYKTWMFKEVPEPWFVTIPNKCTEDVYFCFKCLEFCKAPVTIGVDTKVPTGHKISPEYIGPGNRPELLNYYEKVYPSEHPTDSIKVLEVK